MDGINPSMKSVGIRSCQDAAEKEKVMCMWSMIKDDIGKLPKFVCLFTLMNHFHH